MIRLSDLLRMKTNELGDTAEKLAHDKQDLEDTTNQLAADRKFLATVKDQCAMFDQEFAERRQTRQEETEAGSKALTILSGDDAHDLFGKTFNNAAFLQERSSRNAGRRSQASAVLVASTWISVLVAKPDPAGSPARRSTHCAL